MFVVQKPRDGQWVRVSEKADRVDQVGAIAEKHRAGTTERGDDALHFANVAIVNELACTLEFRIPPTSVINSERDAVVRTYFDNSVGVGQSSRYWVFAKNASYTGSNCINDNAISLRIDRWFLFANFALPDPFATVYSGISLLDGPGPTALLTRFGRTYREYSQRG